MMNERTRFEFEKDAIYQLISVTDKAGKNKAVDGSFYEERINCIATNFHYDDCPSHGRFYRLHMDFVQKENGDWVKRHLHTSTVREVEENEFGLIIYTSYSIYTFKKAVLKEAVYQDAANLIELYMSMEDDFYFGKGFYYDKNKQPHELKKWVHLGMFQDSVLIYPKTSDPSMGTVCRYFPYHSLIEFYDTLYHQQEYKTPMLIHNTGNDNLPVKFQEDSRTWTIKPGEAKYIIPYNPKGADSE